MCRVPFILFGVILIAIVNGLDKEPLCLSRYDYDYKLLQKLVELEQQQNTLKQVLEQQGVLISKQEQVIGQLRTKQEESSLNLKQRIEDVTLVTGSTYVRWGRTECPGNGTELVYMGYAGGSDHLNAGAAVNYVCLPSEPMWGKYQSGVQSASYIYGTEYEIFGNNAKHLFGTVVGNNDMPCVVCRSSRSSSLMIPARTACYSGWTMEYTGYLISGAYSHKAATEYVCMDGSPEKIVGGESDQNGKLVYVTEARCGTLKCPPYAEGREIACVVCTL